MARKKRTALPRLTILAYSRRDLQRWVEACEQLAARVLDLERQVNRLAEEVERLMMLPAAAKRRQRPRTDAEILTGVEGATDSATALPPS